MKLGPENITVILVDDDLDDCLYFQEALIEVNDNHTYLCFNSSAAVILYLNLEDTLVPDILFLDLNMPGMDGKDCLKQIRTLRKYSGMPIAIYSTSDSDIDKEETLARGANIYVKKPNSLEKLKSILLKVLNIQWQFHQMQLNIHTFVIAV